CARSSAADTATTTADRAIKPYPRRRNRQLCRFADIVFPYDPPLGRVRYSTIFVTVSAGFKFLDRFDRNRRSCSTNASSVYADYRGPGGAAGLISGPNSAA